MKATEVFAWVSAAAGMLIIAIAVISLFIGRNLFGFTHLVNYFHAANSFLLISVVMFLAGRHKGNGK